ncbi:hypothetical protein [Litorilituus lipolyticus]|uniref:STAS/SEC14 domain-containing protein n=1 Tax=Litorilituus lipolyticus TaxID=2491017 RepID=A0A502KUR3_9GAMM|nr:hypothetical protein [Litorilituus lipolyticus]TPH13433.1 hypothetical protein EPA86_14690 [Litorilituus lipolyticus]
MKFEEHGIFEVKVEGRLLLVEATGPFNEELINQYQSALKSCINTLQGSSWNQVITLHDMSLFTPEAEQALTHSLIERHNKGLESCGVVIGDVNCKALVSAQMSRCYQKANVKHKYFTTLEEAKAWLG